MQYCNIRLHNIVKHSKRHELFCGIKENDYLCRRKAGYNKALQMLLKPRFWHEARTRKVDRKKASREGWWLNTKDY